MKNNKVQFAVVREDPDLLVPILQNNNLNNILMICSGGCSALTYKTLLPSLKIDLIDFNENQIELTKRKIDFVKKKDIEALDQLNKSGNFESLFRQLSSFIFEFVIDRESLEEYLEGKNKIELDKVFNNPYWKVAFDLFFSDSILNIMFGPDATQHAKSGTYPNYFRIRIENALLSGNYKKNYFLHHFLLDEYLDDQKPTYYKCEFDDSDINFIHGQIDESFDLEKYDFVDISNILDWMEPELSKILLIKLGEMKTGSYLIFRQLNNLKDYEKILSLNFEYLKDESERLTAESRSMFYEKISLYKRI